ncbi:FAD dependent oxidoreductase [Ophiobolus disseminans]|uniref:FAD dependent oxidoreductase n=1 Tax=Ophiobolus disseminans TaxID=1469910 RepID=A0A6A7A446_9PLEO|nr:FAD dependent oxidoreductase [Ophiobolus disseminans]
MPENISQTILIIGAGTWGCSIALELARRGHAGITVLDGHPFPSAISAGNDLNKIAEAANEPSSSDSDSDHFWNTIHSLSMHQWKHDPVFSSFYHETGFIMAAVGDDAYQECLDCANSEQSPLVHLNTEADFKSTMPEGVLQSSFPGWRGFWKRKGAGWVFAIGALKAMHDEASRLGVRFLIGDAKGRITEVLYTADKSAVTGARTADGVDHIANQTILAAGASSCQLLDFKQQLRPTAWTLAHLPLSAEEAHSYRNLPVLYGVDRGFFIEPDVEKHEMKICDEHPGYINPVVDPSTGQTNSVPFARQQIPLAAEQRMRRLLRETMPQLADRPFTFARLCWDADTADRIFLIDKHPDIKNIVVAVGGSGHGFMTSPAIGGLVADIVEEKNGVEERVKNMMRWRPEISVGRDLWDTQGRYGAGGKVMDLREVRDWTRIGE